MTNNSVGLSDARARVREVSERLLADMRAVARQDGWALASHGSMSRDLDLIAVPWTDQASNEAAFVEAMRASMARTLGGVALIGAGEDGRTPGVKAKPHGRRSWTIHSTSEQLVETEAGAHPYIDLCVLDLRAIPPASTFLPICEDATCNGNPCITPPASTTTATAAGRMRTDCKGYGHSGCGLCSVCTAAAGRGGAPAAASEVQRLRDALAPFAAVADEWDRWQAKGSTSTLRMIQLSYGRCTIGLPQYEAARAALAEQPAAPPPISSN